MRNDQSAASAPGVFADFQALFNASPTPLLAVTPPDWIIVAANDARLEATSTRREQQIGRPLFELFPDDPADAAATGERNLRASLDRVLRTKAADTMAVQRYPVRDADGRFVDRWWCPINVPVLNDAGEVAIVIHRVEEVTELVRLRGEAEVQDKLVREQQSVIDRLRSTESALRTREHHLQLMVDELNHRVKNALAIVQSIVSQSLRRLGVRDASTIEHRLVALAAAHDVLTAQHWSGAELKDLLRHIQASFGGADGKRFDLAGPDLRLSPQLAVSFALIFHELATNAVKHGALSSPGGTVRVRWTIDEDADRRMLKLGWLEDGGPPVRPPERRGFGTTLIERSAIRMGAPAQLAFEPEGLVCRLAAEL